jgi:uncharacterized protein YdaU (DUF1376 family)
MAMIDVMPFDVPAYISDTQHLTQAQHGAYLLLLMAMWMSGGWIVDDESQLARVCKTTVLGWRKVAPGILALLESRDGKLSQKRLLKEMDEALARRHRRALAGSTGGRAKALKNKRTGGSNATPLLESFPSSSVDSVLTLTSSSSFFTESVKEVRDSQRKKGHALPPHWIPHDEERLYGRTVLHLNDAQIDKAAEKMRRWAISNAHRAVARKSNWDMTFRNWLDNDAERLGTNTMEKKDGQGRSRTLQDDSLSVSKALGRLEEKLSKGLVTFPPRPRLVLPDGDADLRQLPPGRSA